MRKRISKLGEAKGTREGAVLGRLEKTMKSILVNSITYKLLKVPEETHHRIKSLAVKKSLKMQDLTEEILKEGLDRNETR